MSRAGREPPSRARSGVAGTRARLALAAAVGPRVALAYGDAGESTEGLVALNATRNSISAAGQADAVVVFGRTGSIEAGAHGVTALLVPTELTGLTRSRFDFHGQLCIVAISLARSGGPSALMIDPTLRECRAPMSGVMMTSARATTACGLLKPWATQRGVAMESPA